MIRNLFIASIYALGLFISCSSSVKNGEENKKDTLEVSSPRQEKTSVPNIKLTTLDGNELYAERLIGKKLIFILFQPDCEHCQNESRQIAERIQKFSGYELYFISSAELKDIEKFSIDYKLSGSPNIHFAKTEVQSIIDSYGPIPAPSIYIYSAKGELLNSFNGEMEIDVVIKYL